MPQIIPRQFTAAPTNIQPGIGMAIGQGLQDVAGVAQQVEKGRRQADDIEMKLREQQEKNEAGMAYNEKQRARLHAETEIKKTRQPMEYIDALDEWERDYDSKMLQGKSQVFSENFMQYDRQAKYYGLSRMGTDMERAILDQNIAAFETDINSATTHEELLAAIERGREKGISQRVLNATLENESKRIDEDYIYSALNAGDADGARRFLAESQTLDEKSKLQIANVIEAEVNRAEREDLAQQLEDVTDVDDKVRDMAINGSSFSEIMLYIEKNTDPDTMARSLSVNALKSYINPPSDTEREKEIAWAANSIEEAFNQGRSKFEMAAIVALTDEDLPEGILAKEAFRKYAREDYDNFRNKTEIQKKADNKKLYTTLMGEYSSDLQSYISSNSSESYKTLDVPTLQAKMQSLSTLGIQIHSEYINKRLELSDYNELMSKLRIKMVDAANAARGKNSKESDKMGYSHLSNTIDAFYNNPSIPFSVRQRYRDNIYSNLTQHTSPEDNLLAKQKDSVTAQALAEKVHNQTLDRVYKSFGKSDEEIRDIRKKTGMAIFDPVTVGRDIFNSAVGAGTGSSLASEQQLVEIMNRGGFGFTPSEQQQAIQAYRTEYYKQARTVTRPSESEDVITQLMVDLDRQMGHEELYYAIKDSLGELGEAATSDLYDILKLIKAAYSQSGTARKEALESMGLPVPSHYQDMGNE